LAGAACAHDRHEFAPLEREVDPAQDLDRDAIASQKGPHQPGRLQHAAHSWRIASTGVSRAAVSEGHTVASTATATLATVMMTISDHTMCTGSRSMKYTAG